MARLIDNLDLVARGEVSRLRRICAVDDEDLRDMLAELRGYDPRPGLRFGGEPVALAVPDVILAEDAEGGWLVSINQETLPRLIVNRSYYTELRTACSAKDARGWLSERLTDANWLIKALDQRQKTILKVASEIVKHQDGFFRHGVAQLKPLTLRSVAEAIEMHEIDREPRHLEQVSAMRARHVRAEILLHVGRVVRRWRGCCLGGGRQGRDSPVDRRRGRQGDPVGRQPGRTVARKGLLARAAHRRKVSRGHRPWQFGPAAAKEGARRSLTDTGLRY